jgi:hypothetical protein
MKFITFLTARLIKLKGNISQNMIEAASEMSSLHVYPWTVVSVS